MNIVILATRISGTDGVSLEAERWREIFLGMGHKVQMVAGQLDRQGILIPELHFQWPKVVKLHDKVVHSDNDYRKVEREIFELAGVIEGKLRDVFNGMAGIDLLIIPNAFSLPMHFPLAVALARVIEEKDIPTIARHHDFWWERERFLKSSMFPFFQRWFPPMLPTVHHVVVNSIAQKEFEKRFKKKVDIYWDCFDFNSRLNRLDSFSRKWREDFGIREDDIVFLQATRIIPRKRIELAIEFVEKLGDPRVVLVLAGYAGDEAGDYEKKLRIQAKKAGIRCKFIGKRINSHRRVVKLAKVGFVKRRIYTLWDCFVNCDFVTYPTGVEGFGNQFVETMYFKKPIIITPYPVYKTDIKPIGFEVIEIPDRVTQEAILKTRTLIEDKQRRKVMVEKNFELAKKHYSFEAVSYKLKKTFRRMGLD